MIKYYKYIKLVIYAIFLSLEVESFYRFPNHVGYLKTKPLSLTDQGDSEYFHVTKNSI